MRVVWDEIKRAANLTKHGLDFASFEAGFDPSTAMQVPARGAGTGRPRVKLIGLFEGRLVLAAIVAPLGTEAISPIGLGRASRAERSLYEQRQP